MRWMLAPILLILAPAVANADPCEAPLPTVAGTVFSGPVRYVGDGDGLCVGTSADPATWIEVRLADFDAPELNGAGGRTARDRLRALVLGQTVSCRAQRGLSRRVVVWDRVIARCSLQGRSIGDLMRAAGVREGGR